VPKGWKTSVYRMDLDEHPDGKFVAFFYDDDSANTWLTQQEDQSIYEVRTK
jgi:hypothetical protein